MRILKIDESEGRATEKIECLRKDGPSDVAEKKSEDFEDESGSKAAEVRSLKKYIKKGKVYTKKMRS